MGKLNNLMYGSKANRILKLTELPSTYKSESVQVLTYVCSVNTKWNHLLRNIYVLEKNHSQPVLPMWQMQCTHLQQTVVAVCDWNVTEIVLIFNFMLDFYMKLGNGHFWGKKY